MSIRILCISILIFGILLTPALAETPSEEILLKPAQNDTPFFKRSKDQELGVSYSIKMIKIRDNASITAPPGTPANILYFGQVKLGSPPVNYGVLFDLEGKEKQLWVDAEGNGDYSKVSPRQLYKSEKYPGTNVYYSPLPLTFQIKYTYTDHTYQVPIQFELPYLIVAQAGFSDYFYLKTRTWFTGIIPGNNDDIQIALVDTNDNGYYNDPNDLICIDWNYDLNFGSEEAKTIKTCKSIKLPSKLKYKLEYLLAPEKIILKKG
jgi:hypothetical protein